MDNMLLNSFEGWLSTLYENSIKDNKDLTSEKVERIKRFIIHLYSYLTTMVEDGYIENAYYTFVKLTDLDSVLIDESLTKEKGAVAYYISNEDGKHIVTRDLDSTLTIKDRNIYLDKDRLEKLIDYHEITHLLVDDINDRSQNFIYNHYDKFLNSPEERNGLKNVFKLGLTGLNEFAADYISFATVCPEYLGTEGIMMDPRFYMGLPYMNKLLLNHPFSPVSEVTSKILYPDEKDLQKRFKDMSKIVISKNPTDKIYDCLSYDEDKDSTLMQIIFSYASVMELSTEKVDCKSIKKIIRLSKNYHELQKLSRR